jgi:hypothetical protein
MKKCIACGTERYLNDGNDPDSCPGCSRIYAKVEAAASESSAPAMVRSRTQAKPPEGFWSGLGETKRTLIWMLAAFVVGYFAGREHIKYQFLQAFSGVAKGISESFSTPLDRPRTESPAVTRAASPVPANEKLSPPPRPQPITATMTEKGFYNGEYGQDAVTFDITFENKTSRDIRGFNGLITVSDILGNEIMPLRVKITDPVKANSTVVWSGKLDYNMFIDKHQALKNADFQDITTTFETTKVLFQDGEVLELEN